MSIQLRRSLRTSIKWAMSGIATAALVFTAAAAIAADKPQPTKKQISGEEIFRREWIANDPRSHGGDGLGPVFNESSCVACHNLGGVGGAGPVNKNVSLVTAVLPTRIQLQSQPVPAQPTIAPPANFRPASQASPFENPPSTSSTPARTVPRALKASPSQSQRLKAIEKQLQAAQQALIKLHPDFRTSNTVVIHRFGTSELHENWRRSLGNGGVNPSLSTFQSGFSSQGGTATFSRPVAPGHVVGAATGVPQSFDAIQDVRLPSRTLPPSAPTVRVPAITQPFPATSKIQLQIQALKQQVRTNLSFSRPFQTGLLQHSQRNTTALFGAGLIDSIPTTAIEAAASHKHEDFPNVTGRIHRLKENKIGRFGWKAQEASLYDFTMTACAVEVGLHVPDHAQSAVPYQKEVKPAGFDLNRQEAGALVDYLKQLPRPVQSSDAHPAVAAALSEGEKLFTSVGCAACHTKKLGNVDALFSDLLLHDMGPDLGSVGSYGVPSPSPEPLPLADAKTGKPKPVPPTAQEWRTPPLWGVRDSAPYLHDGRADTLDQAIALHGGEAADSRLRFFMQSHEQRQKIITFLKSLTAPDNATAQR